MRSVAAKLRGLIGELGPTGAGSFLLARALTASGIGQLHCYLLVAQPVPAHPGASRPSKLIRVRQVSEQDYQVAWFQRPAAVIRERFRQGAVCFVAFREAQAIGCIWLITDQYLEDEVRCHYILQPAAHTAWDFDVYLHPRHRLGRGFVYLWEAANSWLREHGRHWSLSRIDALNRASLLAHRRQGAVVVGQALFLRLGPLQLLVSNRSPYLHLSPHPGRIPALRVSAPRSSEQ